MSSLAFNAKTGRTCDQRHHGVVHPARCVLVERVERDEKWQSPELEEDCCKNARIDHLREVRAEDKATHADHGAWDGEKVCLDRVKLQLLEGEGEVSLRWSDRNCGASAPDTRLEVTTD
jgi:hypothetical protein